MIKICNIQDAMQIQEYMDLLEYYHIPCYKKESGSGEYLKITTGLSLYGTDFYVQEKDQKKAKQALDVMRQKWDLREMQAGWSDDEEEKIRIPWYKNRVITSRIILVVLLFMIVFASVSGIIF